VRKRLLAPVERIDQVLMEYAVDEVLIALPIKSCYEMIQQVLDKCERAGVQANYWPMSSGHRWPGRGMRRRTGQPRRRHEGSSPTTIAWSSSAPSTSSARS
jgi:hypothetical protein